VPSELNQPGRPEGDLQLRAVGPGRVRESETACHLGPVDNQLVRIETTGLVRAQGTAVVVTVAGEIDFVTVYDFRTAIAAGFGQLRDAETLIIDLTGVTFMNSEGLQALIEATQADPQGHRSLRIVADRTGSVRRRINMTGLDNILPLFDAVEDALQMPS